MQHRFDIDAIKGISIIAVVLYHLGIMPNGYLGVDAFLVINGFFIIPKIYESLGNNSFNYIAFIKKRLIRLMPLVVIATAVSLCVGAIGMMPDNYENLCESIFATNVCANNVLAALTTKNYWDVANAFKPLMHTWYLGILVQFYIIFPLVMMFVAYLGKLMCTDVKSLIRKLLYCVVLISVVGFILPSISYYTKFYYLPFRLFELCSGGLVGLIVAEHKSIITSNYVKMGALITLLFSLIYPIQSWGEINNVVPIGTTITTSAIQTFGIYNKIIWLLITVFATLILLFPTNHKIPFETIIYNRFIQFIGKISFSIFIWHQIILAFYRYYVSPEGSLPFLFFYIVIVFLISIVTYKYIENMTINRIKILSLSAIYCVVSVLSLLIYFRAGVIRDVPELGITYENPYVCRNTEYTDKIYGYDHDYNDTDKINILVVGNSFARDFACVLLESDVSSRISLSYSFSYNENLVDRIQKSDFIFSFSSKTDVPDYVWSNLKEDAQVWGIGTKNYGASNGMIYSKRFRNDYFQQTVRLNENYAKLNSQWKHEWGNRYIDFIELSKMPDGTIRIFTPDNKYISQDCRHLTEYGAKFYASIIDFNRILIK